MTKQTLWMLRAIVSLAVTVSGWSQTGSGTIQGTVVDSTSASVGGARVTARHLATNVVAESTSNAEGRFVYVALAIGQYDVEVEASGFKRWRGKIELQAGQTLGVRAILQIGDTSSEITVAADAANLVTTENATLGRSLERSRLEQLPLNGRNLQSLITLTTPGMEGTGSGQRTNGMRSSATEYIQDGASLANRDIGGLMGPPGIDTVQEVRVETSGSSARMNRPAVAILTTRSGTNQLHGSAFETARNNGLAVARSRQDNFVRPPQLIRNEFGVSMGGPIRIPKLYDGRNRSFIFGAYEGARQRQKATLLTTVPTGAMRQGDFSGLVNGSGQRITLYDPWSTDTSTYARVPYVNNQLPANRLSPLAKQLYGLMPVATLPDVNPLVAPNLSGEAPSNSDNDRYTFRFDQILNSRNNLAVRYSKWSNPQISPGSTRSFPTTGGVANQTYINQGNWSSGVNWNYTASPTLIFETIASLAYNYQDVRGGVYGNWSEQLGLQNSFGGNLFPFIQNIGFYQFVQPDNRRNNRTWIGVIDENVTKVLGKHTLQFGGRYRVDRVYEQPDGSSDPSLSYGAASTGVYNPATGTAYGVQPLTGHAAASFYLGLLDSYTLRLIQGMYYFWDREYAAYFQDDWKITPRLTLNLGLRYEYMPPTKEGNGLFSSFDLAQGKVVTGRSIDELINIGRTRREVVAGYEALGVRYATPEQAGLPNSILRTDKKGFSPRLGLAYRVTTGNRPVVLRAGYAVFTYPIPTRNWYASLRQNPPFQASFTRSFTNPALSPDGFANYNMRSIPTVIAGQDTRNIVDLNGPAPFALGGFGVYGFDEKQPMSRVREWNISLEKEVLPGVVGRATYLGNHGLNLEQWQRNNQAPSDYIWLTTTGQALPTGARANVARREFPNLPYADIQTYRKTGWSNHNGVQLEVERRYQKGYAYQFFYVLSNTFRVAGDGWRDDFLDQTNVFMPGAVPTEEKARNRFLNYRRDIAVPKHRIRYNWLMDLPFGRGKMVGGNAGRLWNSLIGGWQVAGFGNMASNYFTLPTSNWGSLGNVEVYGKKYPIQDCRSGVCYDGYLYWNGYIPANRINSVDARGLPNGVMGVPTDYKPSNTPIYPTPASGIPAGGTVPANLYETNAVFVTLKDNSTVQTSLNTNLHPWRNQYLRGPWSFGLDASLFKSVRIGEVATVRFNADFFGVMNNPGLPQPGADGIVSLRTSANAPRQLQLTLRVTW